MGQATRPAGIARHLFHVVPPLRFRYCYFNLNSLHVYVYLLVYIRVVIVACQMSSQLM